METNGARIIAKMSENETKQEKRTSIRDTCAQKIGADNGHPKQEVQSVPWWLQQGVLKVSTCTWQQPCLFRGNINFRLFSAQFFRLSLMFWSG